MKDDKNIKIPIEQDKFAPPIVSYKGVKYFLSQLQFKIFRILSNGQRHTSHQLMQQCKTSDPRKNVQNLRSKGFNVRDVWIAGTPDVPRHKQYWIDPAECGEEVNHD